MFFLQGGEGLDFTILVDKSARRQANPELHVAHLMNLFKEEVLNQKKTKAMVSTIRDAFFLIPGKLIHSSRQWILKLEATWSYRNEFVEALCRVT